MASECSQHLIAIAPCFLDDALPNGMRQPCGSQLGIDLGMGLNTEEVALAEREGVVVRRLQQRGPGRRYGYRSVS